MTLRTSTTLAAACLAVFGSLTFASLEAAGNERHERGVEVMDHLSGGAGQPVLEALRKDYPFLAEGITQYALGDVWGRSELDDRTRQLAVIAAFAAQGNLQY
ncbi:gamma-carboxymuconolactone decarboxylase, partial [Stutzerimonas stutzeri ATCC 14405 = CCUG 16156]